MWRSIRFLVTVNKEWLWLAMLFLCFSGLVLTGVAIAAQSVSASQNVVSSNWRHHGSPEEQLKTLVKLTPGTHHWMPEIAYRYQNIYWGAKQGKWQYTQYQIRSMEKMLKQVALARPKRAASVAQFQQQVFPRLYRAADSQNWPVFAKAVAETGEQCTACHAKEGFAYITIPAIPPKPNSVVLGYPAAVEE